ncbi:M1 family metallopeptidase [Nannocystis radixulma]|uniref:M1 family metallopeptidase n=1 Tax=Nannocystis radixulma TaxID=2995305 RepID=A0ABT5AXJ4_9BACT|nr:M1 family metallopeptidase [Nannocystis radixulma]MDC0666564.1 M1 family metallopeptidase [Nannocystis radixulma]
MGTRLLRRAAICALVGAIACEPAAPPERQAPEPSEPLRPPDVRGPIPDGIKLADYVLDASLDAEKHTVSGTARITWRNSTRSPVDALVLHLYMNGFRAEDTAWMAEARGAHRGARQGKGDGKWGYIDVRAARLLAHGPAADFKAPEQRDAAATTLTLVEGSDPSLGQLALPQAVGPGEAVTVELDFFTQLPRVFARTGYDGEFHMVGQWYPKLAVRHEDRWQAHVFTLHSEFYADFGDYEVHLDVPEDMVVGATGVQVEARPPENGRKQLSYRAEAVHDFAWAASPDFLEYSDMWRDVRIRQLIPRALAGDVQRHLDAQVAALESMDARFGPYPWSTITIVHPPESAGGAQGMEYPTLYTTSDILRLPLPLRLLGLHELLTGEFTTIHEFGHQYFQGLLASDEATQPWLDEGINSFSNTLALDDWLGADASIARIGNQRVSTVDMIRVALGAGSELDPVDRPADEYRDFTGTFGGTVYRKTAAVFHTLRALVGPEKFDRAFRIYCDTWRFRHPTGDDLVAVLLRELGAKVRISETGPDGQPVDLDLRDYLEQGLKTTAAVDFKVARLANKKAVGTGGWHRGQDGALALAELEAPEDERDEPDDGASEGFALIVREGEFRVPVELEFEFKDGARERLVWDGQARYRVFTFPGRRLAAVAVDPDDKLLLEGERLDNHMRAPGHYKPDGISDPAARFAEAADLALLGGLGL